MPSVLSLERLNALLLARAGVLLPSPQMMRAITAGKRLPHANGVVVFWLKRRGAIDANDRITDRGRAMIRTALDG